MDYEKKYKEALEWARKVIQGKVGFVLDEVLEKFPELKESEGEKIRDMIIESFNYTNPWDFLKNRGVDKQSVIAWLEKQGEQKSAEWGERDEKLLNDAISLAYECDDIELRDWLKSLRPQNTWKPSDEQMTTLEYYMHTLVCNEHKEILFGLYEDLKKLK